MTTGNETVRPEQTVAELATRRPGASRVFYRHGLDFCCGGHVSLADACHTAGLETRTLIDEIEAEDRSVEDFERWDERGVPEMIDHILVRFHEPHRAELPRLLAMAEKVERVHGEKPSCPRGLAARLARMHEELVQHMEKEERVLFPLLRAGRGRMAAMPIQVMEQEHTDHGRNLQRLRELTNDYQPPAEACGTWTALYLGLAELERELMQHIHLENNVLFPRALRG